MKNNNTMEQYNQGDEVIVQFTETNNYYAQVVSCNGNMVQVIVGLTTDKVKDFMYDMSYGVNKDMITQKIYDAKTDKCLVD